MYGGVRGGGVRKGGGWRWRGEEGWWVEGVAKHLLNYRVVGGMETLTEMEQVPTDAQDKPKVYMYIILSPLLTLTALKCSHKRCGAYGYRESHNNTALSYMLVMLLYKSM